MWSWPRWAIAYLLTVEIVIACWAAGTVLTTGYHRWDLLRFLAFAACAAGYLRWTRESEERRRDARGQAAHIDQTSIWVFSAALVLPAPLMLLLLVLVRVQRYRIARKPLYTFVLTTFTIAAAALGVHAVATQTPLRDWLTGARPWPNHPAELLLPALAVLAAIGWYFLAQALLVGLARGLAGAGWSLPDLLGDRETNLFVLTTLFLGTAVALVQSLSLLLLILMVPVAVRSTRVEQQLLQAKAERERLRVDALHDPLTSLPNRRGFDPSAEMALLADQSANHTTALLFLDLDHFKAWNSTLGHIGADQVLVAVAEVLRSGTRHGDLLCRWGGEEMAILLPNTGRESAWALAERLRQAVSELRVRVTKPAGGTPIQLNSDGVPGCTVSIGIAFSPWHGTALKDLEELADQAVEHAKRTGRDRVVLAPDDRTEPVVVDYRPPASQRVVDG